MKSNHVRRKVRNARHLAAAFCSESQRKLRRLTLRPLFPFSDLIPELRIHVADQLATSDLFALARTNKEFHSQFMPLLYQRAVSDLRPAISTPFQWIPTPGRSILHFAAAHNNAPLLTVILDRARGEPRKRLLNMPDRYGNTPLISAVLLGHTEMVRVLLSAGADANRISARTGLISIHVPGASTPQKLTPLHIAAITGNCEVAKLLIELGGANRSQRDWFGHEPAHLVALASNWQFRTWRRGLPVTPIAKGAEYNERLYTRHKAHLASLLNLLKTPTTPEDSLAPAIYSTICQAQYIVELAYMLNYESDRCRWCARGSWKASLMPIAHRACQIGWTLRLTRKTQSRGRSGCEEAVRKKDILTTIAWQGWPRI